jgi:hypothetical protein
MIDVCDRMEVDQGQRGREKREEDEKYIQRE